MSQTVRWGLLATGSIAETFAAALQEADGAELAAVGSRNLDKAQAFATRYGVARAHGSYAELATDPDVDAVYVATPHAFHERDTRLCLEHGKHVLCEKPFALNAAQAGRMVAAAEAADRLLMEAMWTRFLPSLIHVRRSLADGVIGTPRSLVADFGIRPAFDPASRLFDAALGGGALLDLGIYAVSMARWLFGPPVRVTGAAHLGPTGVDDDSALVLLHTDGELATAHQSLRIETPRQAVIYGTEGHIRLHTPWWGTSRITVQTAAGSPETTDFALRGAGYTHMAEAFMDLIRTGRRESDVMPLAESTAIMGTMDALRAQWGLRYPGE